jgi:hypothetical protein
MAKGNLPRIDGVPVQVQQELEPVRKQEHAPIAEGYLPRRVDVKLPKYHARVLRDKLRQLQDDGARVFSWSDETMSSISTLSFDLQSVAPMFFGAPVFEKKKSDETHEQLEERVWRDKVRQNADGHVYIQPFALKNALEAAGSRLNMKLTGKATYTKLFRQGIVINDEIVLHDRSGKPVTIEAIRPIPMFRSAAHGGSRAGTSGRGW